MPPLRLDELSCAICLETPLYKPSVNHCGHAFCFWCMHHAMSGIGASTCPLCRAGFKHFPAVCKPLHIYLQHHFPDAIAEREAAVKVQESQEWNAESPDIPLPPEITAAKVLNGRGYNRPRL